MKILFENTQPNDEEAVVPQGKALSIVRDALADSELGNDVKVESLNEAVEDEDRIQALADHLFIDPQDISNIDEYEYEAPGGRTYLVVDENEAWDLARQSILDIFDDLGLDSFTEHFREWVLDNALDAEDFRDVVEEGMQNYIDDIAEEEDATYGTALIAEMIAAECIDEEDLEDPEFDVDDHIDDLLSFLVDWIAENDGYLEWCISQHGEEWVGEYAIDNDLFDMELIVEECIDLDGVAHFIATGDGYEIELANGLYAYRTN